MSNLGTASLTVELLTKTAEAAAKRFESEMKASLKRIASASDGIISAKSFSGANAGAKAATAALAPLNASIRSVSNSLNDYKVRFEGGQDAQDKFVSSMRGVISNATKLRDTVDQSSTQYGRLTNVIGTATRSITTAEGQVSKLGLSQQVALGTTNRWRDGLGSLQTAIVPLVGAAGIGGLVAAASSFVGEAQRAESSARLFDKAVERSGLNAGEASDLVTRLADTYGVLPSVIQEAALPILRAGGSIEDVSNALTAAGASAAAGGSDIARAMVNIGQAVATGRSELTEAANVTVNSSDAYKRYAEVIGVSVDALTEQQKVQAFASAIMEESKYEVADLTEVLTPQVKAQQDFRTAMAEARQELGGAFAPALATGATAAASLLKGFDGLPDTMQSSVISIGGVSTAVAALAVGANGLRLALVPLLAPPAGFLVAGAVIAATLGTAIYNLAKNHEDAADKVARLTTEASNLKVPLDDLKEATSKQQLLGNIETLAETMDGDAKTAFVNYANTAVESAKTTGDAVIGVMQGIAVARRTILEDAVQAQETLLADLQRNVDESQTQFNIATATGGDGNTSSQVERLRGELAEVKQLYGEAQQNLTAAADSGNKARAQKYQEDVNAYASLIDQIQSELNEALNNTPTGRLNFDTAQLQEAQRDLRGLQGQLTELNTLIRSGSSEELEAYFNRGAEGATNLNNSLSDTASTSDNAASSTSDLADAVELLNGQFDELGSYTPLADSASDLTTSLDRLREVSLNTAEAQERAVQAAKDLTAANKEAANQASPYDASGPTALTEALEAAVTASGYMTDAQREANLELREGATSAESFSDSLAGLNDEGRIAGQYFSTAAVSASDFTTSLDQLNDEAHEASTRLRDADTSAESLSDSLSNLNDLAFRVSQGQQMADDLENASEKAELLNKAGLEAIEIFGKLATEILGADSAMGIFASTATSAISALASGDILGFFSAIVDGILDMGKHFRAEMDSFVAAVQEVGFETAKQFATLGPNGSIEFDEAGYSEYLQYLDAVKQYGKEIADNFYQVGEDGKRAFNEEGLAAFADGLERVKDRADGIAQAMKAAKDATDSVLDAEISARQDTLDAKLASQDGGYSEADIFEQQAISIGEAAKKRDSAYQEAADLEAAGQAELAARRRAAAEEAYAAEVSQINSEAEGRAEAIGKNSEDFRSRLDQAAQTEGQKWTEYWNQDAAAQIEAQKQAQIQLRRFQQVLNSDRYQELLAAGVAEADAWRIAAAEAGYAINETSGDLVAATDAASQQQSQAITNSGNLLAGAATNLFGGASTQIATDGATLRGQIVGEGSLLSSSITSALGLANTAFGTQGSALSSTIASVYDSLIGTATDGSNLFGGALTNGANLNIGTVADVGNLLGGQITDSGNANKDAIAAAANLQIKQAAEAAKKFSLNDVNFANEVNRVSAKIANARVGVIDAAAVFQSGALVDFWNDLIDTNVEGNQKYARSATGGTERVGNRTGRRGVSSGRRGNSGLSFKGLNLFDLGIAGVTLNPDYAEVIEPAKYNPTKPTKVDPSKPGKGSSGSKGSGSKGGKGSGGKKDGSTYTGGKSSEYPQGSPGWYQARMQEIEEQIKKTASASKIRSLQAQKAKLQAAYDALMGTGKDADKSAPAGSINEIEERLSKAREAFENATTDATRAQAAERVKVLEAELKEKRKLLEDAAKDAQEAVKGTVISIESPIADLGSLQYLAESVSKSVPSLPTSISAASTGAAASVTRIPETYTSTVLPSYQAQRDMAAAMGGHVDRFGGHIDRFGAIVTRLERLERRNPGNLSPLVSEARGDSITSYQFK